MKHTYLDNLSRHNSKSRIGGTERQWGHQNSATLSAITARNMAAMGSFAPTTTTRRINPGEEEIEGGIIITLRLARTMTSAIPRKKNKEEGAKYAKAYPAHSETPLTADTEKLKDKPGKGREEAARLQP